jgi:nucleotide-binding universal stress UspA family protein
MAQIAQILLASDLTDRSWCALVRAIQLKRATAAGLTLLHVVEGAFAEGPVQSRGTAAKATMEGLLSRASGGKLRRVVIKVLPGDPVAEIVAEAGSRSADLVVLGEPEKHRVKELFVGTTAERVVRHSRRPVLVAKVRSDQPYRRVLIAFDRSEAAQQSLTTALALAPRAEFRLVHARQNPEPVRVNEGAERTQVLLENTAKQAIGRSLYPHTILAVEVREGVPVPVITNALVRFGPDLLAMGTHSRGKLETAFFGSVAQELLAASSCDALVAPPRTRER